MIIIVVCIYPQVQPRPTAIRKTQPEIWSLSGRRTDGELSTGILIFLFGTLRQDGDNPND